ncbi:MAG: type II toxin-antitoxin system prevent-host-death family antitoxin [Deltaproteobacteria bacterium]|nr:type II toxin-antitoxin system prevent-host-death family antitoxin [Deltaproteobacteria bacterium]
MPHIYPVSDLKNNLSQLSEICRKEHEPVYLTRRGHGELVLLGIEEYECMLAKLKTTEEEDAEIEALWVSEIQERYRAIQEGTVTCIPADEAMRQARERLRPFGNTSWQPCTRNAGRDTGRNA